MTESQSSFRTLVERAKAGDKDAFSEIYETHLTPVYRYLYIRLGNREAAEDITQETFLKAYQAIDRFEATRDNFLPYLFTVARNLLINYTKKKRPDVHAPEEIDREVSGEDTMWFAEQGERRISLQSALSVLTDSEREIVELRFFGERSYKEIAEFCGKKEDAIRQHIARSMKKMRNHLNQKEIKKA